MRETPAGGTAKPDWGIYAKRQIEAPKEPILAAYDGAVHAHRWAFFSAWAARLENQVISPLRISRGQKVVAKSFELL